MYLAGDQRGCILGKRFDSDADVVDRTLVHHPC